jgi:phenylacetic acid degradation operon negative regulatory protein
VWISPNDLADRVKEIAESYDASEYIEVFRSEHLGVSTDKQLVEKCWNLDEINKAYEEFISRYQPQYERLKEQVKNEEDISDAECFVEKTKLVHEYRKFLFIDPSLPEELLPDFWTGREADRLFRHYYELLHPGAVRFFLSVFKSAPE